MGVLCVLFDLLFPGSGVLRVLGLSLLGGSWCLQPSYRYS